MSRDDIKDLYSVSTDSGALVVVRRDVDKWLSGRGQYWATPDVLINPEIRMDDGILSLRGMRHSYVAVRNVKGYGRWVPKPLSEMKHDWRNLIFYKPEDIVKVEVSKGMWPFNTKTVEDHLNDGYYLNKNGTHYTTYTSNYRLIGYDFEEKTGRI